MSFLKATGLEFRKVGAADEFGRVAVLYGGTSSERAVSLKSGAAVLDALVARGVDAHGIDPAEVTAGDLALAGFDRAFIALHGPGGEDGAMQGMLEWLGLPYTGSGVQGSAICMDKLRTKQLAGAAGVGTPRWLPVATGMDTAAVVRALGLPLIVKPASQGSSVGMSKVTEAGQLEGAIAAALAEDPVAIAESWVTGQEYTVAVLQGEALPSIRIETPRGFYDYEAKYLRNDTQYHCPSGLEPEREAQLRTLALRAFRAAGAAGWGRVDFMVGADGVPLMLEINTVPGMTDHSLVPMAARVAGLSFEDLCWHVLETSFARERVA
jgi:D-alanine-D-alanine ligase